MLHTNLHITAVRAYRQRGASLIMVLMILIVVSLLGVGGAQIALMGERGTRNDRDQQVAFQAAEAALVDAEFDMLESTVGGNRKAIFDGKTNQNLFLTNCGTSGQSKGLCAFTSTGHPVWLDVDYTDVSAGAPTTAFGTFTGRTFAAGGVGVQPALAPRYVIEMVPDPTGDATDPKYFYRVTAMGFGPNVQTQVVLQMLYRR